MPPSGSRSPPRNALSGGARPRGRRDAMSVSNRLLSVYDVDKAGAELCRDMQIVGFAFDGAHARRLRDHLVTTEVRARDAADEAVVEAGGDPIARTKTGGFSACDLQRAFRETLRAPVYIRS